MNIRYRLEDLTTGEIKTIILSLEEIEAGHASLANRILSRDIGTGLKDKTGKREIFENDIDRTFDQWKAKVVFGRSQSHVSGELGIGFYLFDGSYCRPLSTIETEHEIIGREEDDNA